MEPEARGYWRIRLKDVPAGSRYYYVLDDGRERPDPASHFQPEGVHGPSQVVDHAAFHWTDQGWRPPALEQLILYELHVGTFSQGGDFEGVIAGLDDLLELGVNSLSLLPVAQFPGRRNWGYDGAFPFAVQDSYGGPDGFKRLVNACHGRGLAVILDVVYNHLGPEGNVLADFGPYFTSERRTPWGDAVNFDRAWSDEVRNFYFENAIYWRELYHLDGLRLDAVHAIHDESARPFLRELAERVALKTEGPGRPMLLIAESDLNDVRVIAPPEAGGYGLHAQFNDDFHHALHAVLTGERQGYYEDFGGLDKLAKALGEGFVYSWDYSPFRQRHHGSSSAGRPASQFIVFSQNHDQVGNRPRAERLASLVSFEALKVAAGTVLLSPFVPLVFMGEEYGETAPFHYFISALDPSLAEAVRKGRSVEFALFGEPAGFPDPQDPSTFLASKLRRDRRSEAAGRTLLRFYRQLIRLRRTLPALSLTDKTGLDVFVVGDKDVLCWRQRHGSGEVLVVANFDPGPAEVALALSPDAWDLVLDSSAKEWGGPGSRLPATLMSGRSVVLNGSSLALFVLSEGTAEKPGPDKRT